MKLQKISTHVYISGYEEVRDRPSLGLIAGSKFNVAVDAGHSKEHVEEFYQELEKEGLDLPGFTVLTHWHWDHTFGMHAVNGLTVSEQRTEDELARICGKWNDKSENYYKHLNPEIALEYKNQPLIVSQSDMVFHDRLTIDAGSLVIECFHTESPHTDDSTLIFVPEDKVLFVGDCICGVYPSWEIDPIKMNALKNTLYDIDFEIAVGGHWDLFSKKSLMELLVG